MVFASGAFLYAFLPLFLALYYAAPRSWRTAVVALASYVFYGWWRPDFVLLMWVSTTIDYTCGRAIARARSADGEGAGRRWLVLSLVTNLSLLGYFKYADFGIASLNALLGRFGVEPIPALDVVLPVGISFYTFQTISYTVDVYRGHAAPVRSFVDFACYVAMFPQLVAGPIVRYGTIADQLHRREHRISLFYRGVLAFQAGLTKKVLIADVLGGLADSAFDGRNLGALDAWVGLLAYTFQIYFDFSGYSDMAIGLGLMIGFRLPVNFDRPYASRSITEFWRRWHISLSSFLRDYLYVPLGGNRRGPLRTYGNLAATMLLGGLWHGAAWKYVVWGGWQGAWLCLERAAGKRAPWARLPRAGQVAVTFLVVALGWVFFRAENMDHAGRFLASLTGAHGAGGNLQVRPLHLAVGAVASVLVWAAPTTQELLRSARARWAVPLQAAFLVALLHLHHEADVPFLYFQF